MRIETRVYLKNGEAFGANDLTNENKQNVIVAIEKAKNTNGFINLQSEVGSNPIKAQDRKSVV